jgi:hypothetical protein
MEGSSHIFTKNYFNLLSTMILFDRQLYEKVMRNPFYIVDHNIKLSDYYYQYDYPFPNLNYCIYSFGTKEDYLNRIKLMYYNDNNPKDKYWFKLIRWYHIIKNWIYYYIDPLVITVLLMACILEIKDDNQFYVDVLKSKSDFLKWLSVKVLPKYNLLLNDITIKNIPLTSINKLNKNNGVYLLSNNNEYILIKLKQHINKGLVWSSCNTKPLLICCFNFIRIYSLLLDRR